MAIYGHIWLYIGHIFLTFSSMCATGWAAARIGRRNVAHVDEKIKGEHAVFSIENVPKSSKLIFFIRKCTKIVNICRFLIENVPKLMFFQEKQYFPCYFQFSGPMQPDRQTPAQDVLNENPSLTLPGT